MNIVFKYSTNYITSEFYKLNVANKISSYLILRGETFSYKNEFTKNVFYFLVKSHYT